MFAVIGKKIVDKLNSSTDFQSANNSNKPEVIPNVAFVNTQFWNANGSASIGALNSRLILSNPVGVTAVPICYVAIQLVKDREYICNFTYTSTSHPVSVSIGTTAIGHELYEGYPNEAGSTKSVTFTFTATTTGTHYFNYRIEAQAEDIEAQLYNLSLKEVGDKKVFPVIIPQEVDYPATTYEIMNVSNFMAKSSSLSSCDVTIRISCFADSYTTTYDQAKAVVEALDLYQVTYTEDGQSYTAKFRFINLDDEYYKNAEKFYKNITFDCLIIKN